MTGRTICYLAFSVFDLDLVVPQILSDAASVDNLVHLVVGFHYDEFASRKLESVLALSGVRTSRLVPDWDPHEALENHPHIWSPLFCFDRESPIGDALAKDLTARYDWNAIAHQVQAAARAVEHVLKTLRPSLVWLPEESDYIRGALARESCRRLQIPTSVFYSRYHNRIASYPRLVEGGSERYLVRDEALATVLTDQGIPESRIQMVRDPAIDGLSIHAEVDSDVDILFVLQNHFWEHRILSDICEFDHFAKLSVAIRQHPRARNEDVAKLQQSLPQIRDLSSVSPLEALSRSLAVISESSHLLELAKAIGRIAACTNYGGFPPELDRNTTHAPQHIIRNRTDLWQLLNTLLSRSISNQGRYPS